MPNPEQFGLPYHDLELTAQDSTKLRCYLLVQTKDLPQTDATEVPFVENITSDEEVCNRLLCLLQASVVVGPLMHEASTTKTSVKLS